MILILLSKLRLPFSRIVCETGNEFFYFVCEFVMYTELELNRIKWQCRRGMKELDLMVQTFFDNEFLKLSDDDQKIFVKLLDESDLNLFRWLLRGETPATDDFKHIIDIMVEAHDKLQEQTNS